MTDVEGALNEFQERLLAAGVEKADASHHRVPRFYLRNFASQHGRLRLVDPTSGEERLVGAKTAFAEEGYYTIRIGENEEPSAIVEELYGALENAAAPVHRRLTGGMSPDELDAKDRINYAAFIAAQITRGELFNELDRELSETLGKALLDMSVSRPKESWDALRQDALRDGEGPLPDQATARAAVASGKFELRHSPEFAMRLRLAAVPDLTYILADFAWHTVHFDVPCLFSSEHPISYWRPPTPLDRFHGIGPMTADEVRFPLSPTVALVMTHPRFPRLDRSGKGSPKTAATLNWWTWFFQRERTLLLSPEVRHHPLPLGDLLPSIVDEPQYTGLRDLGPIIDH